MTLGSVARVAMEYRQHLHMLNNISKLTANLSTDSKANKLGLPNCLSSECFHNHYYYGYCYWLFDLIRKLLIVDYIYTKFH